MRAYSCETRLTLMASYKLEMESSSLAVRLLLRLRRLSSEWLLQKPDFGSRKRPHLPGPIVAAGRLTFGEVCLWRGVGRGWLRGDDWSGPGSFLPGGF